ncbi:MAG: aminotransferase class I/II-fold pyridoxal phosphate-dependent enzyme [Thaumarchaeota archaeon]|nr:aminotransferase class I/II-fold pyridoxal phosphate-dependent enzyme [Nitrososphaerota archaeon]
MESKPSGALSKRLENVPASVMFEFADRIRVLQEQGINITDLSLGQPEVPAPGHIARALQRALEKPILSYTSAAGSQELRSLIANKLSQESGREVTVSQVIVTCGSKHALFITLLSLLDPGDEIIVHEPYFPPYAEIAGLTGAKLTTVPVAVNSETGFSLDVDEMIAAVTSKTKVILVNYPNNPAGWTLDGGKIKRLADFCMSRGIYFVSDEIYDKIVFDGKVHTHAWEYSDQSRHVIELGSFSKTYSMVPYRLGFIVAKDGVCSELLKTQRATITMVSPYIQAAGSAALKGPQDFVAQRLRKYEERRDKCVELLSKQNIRVAKPEGAFYLFVKMPDKVNVAKFALDFLEEEHIALLPGEIFGIRWRNYVRMSFATPDENLYPAIERFSKRYGN